MDALLSRSKRLECLRNQALVSLLVYGTGWVSSRYVPPRSKHAQAVLAKLQAENLIARIPAEIRTSTERTVADLMRREDEAWNREHESISETHPDVVTDWRFVRRHWYDMNGLVEPFIDAHLRNRFGISIAELDPSTRELGFDDPMFYPEDDENDLIGRLSLCEDLKAQRIVDFAEDDLLRLRTIHDDELVALAHDYAVEPSSFGTRRSLIKELRGTIKKHWEGAYERDRDRMRYAIAAVETKEMLKWSSTNSSLVKMHLPDIPYSGPAPSNAISEQSYQVYQIILRDVTGFPRVASIDDVLRLRDDKRIAAFRDVVQEWAQILRYGNGRYAELLRRDIQKANEDLKKVSDWTQTSALAVLLAFPLWAIDQLRGTAWSEILMVVSGVYEIRSRILQKQNEWVLLGR